MMLTVEHGTFAHPHGHELLRDVNFSVQTGDLLAILGSNGVGKTTLLRCIMGFLHWKQGCSTLDGVEIQSLPPRVLWQQLAYVPQARHATAAYTVEETVLLGRSSHIGIFSQPSADDLVLVHRVLKDLNIFALRYKKCTQLSGGELQMTLLARALAQQPRVLVLDEPESNLDFKNQLLILQTLSRLVAQGMVCIFNTHYPAHALQRANKALLLTKQGEALFGNTADIVTEVNIARAFGVKVSINRVETDETELQSVIPLSLTSAPPSSAVGGVCADETVRTENLADTNSVDASCATATPNAFNVPPPCVTRIATVAIIARSGAVADTINSLLHAYHDSIIGRMGLPYPHGGVYIINVTLDAPDQQVRALVQQLAVLPGVSAKATFAQDAPL